MTRHSIDHPLVGSSLGGYAVRRKLGDCGSGPVFEAVDAQGQRVTLQLIAGSASAQRLARLEQAAEASSRVRHPNLVACYGLGRTEEGVTFSAMEFVDGEDLVQVLRRGPLPWTEAVRIARRIAAALAAIHEAGLVHGALEPSAVLLSAAGEVKVTDFFAPYGERDRAGWWSAPGFLSPEACRGERLDGLSDLYSLGAILFTLVSGRRPFNGRSVSEVICKHVEETPLDPRLDRPELPQAVAQVILRCLAKEPDARYATAQDLAAALDEAEHAQDGAWAPPEPGERTPLDVVAARSPLGADEVVTTLRRAASRLRGAHRKGEARGGLGLGQVRIGVLGDVQLGPPDSLPDPRVQRGPSAGGASATPADDLYALGVVGAALATGRLPYPADTLEGLAKEHAAGPPDLSGLPVSLRNLLLNLLLRDPRLGYRAADELIDEIDLLAGGQTPAPRGRGGLWRRLRGALLGALS